MTSSSADCTLAGARLISSASRRLANTGPSSVRNVPSPGCQMRRADEVGRHEVGGELDAAEAAAEDGGERAHGQRLGEAGHALEQHVAAGEQRDEQALEHRVLADDDALALVQRRLERAAHLGGGIDFGGLGHGGSFQSTRPNMRMEERADMAISASAPPAKRFVTSSLRFSVATWEPRRL